MYHMSNEDLKIQNSGFSILKSAEQLTEVEKKEFTDYFYDLWNEETMGKSDRDSHMPWGMPWYYAVKNGNLYPNLQGNSIKEFAENFFNNVKPEIKQIYKDSFEYQ